MVSAFCFGFENELEITPIPTDEDFVAVTEKT